MFEKRYAEQFPSNKGQPACSFRQALGSQIIKERYQFSDEMTIEYIAMNPYLQYFIGLSEYRQTAPFDPSMMSRFRQRLTSEMFRDVNNVITGRKTVEQIVAEEKMSMTMVMMTAQGMVPQGAAARTTSRKRRMNQMEGL